MLASEAAIAFPALLLLEGDDYYSEALNLEGLTRSQGLRRPQLLDHEIVDSEGKRFLIRELVNIERVKAKGSSPLWMRGWRRLFPGEPLFRFDLELEPLPPASFAETHRHVMEREWAQEAYHISEGGAPDGRESRERLERCRSIADIIARNNPSYEPPESDLEPDVIESSTKSEAILASDAQITFPALLFYPQGDYYDAVPAPEHLRYARSVRMDLLGRELVDSLGRRFRTVRFVGLEERVELRRKTRWSDFWDDGLVYSFDLELEPLPSVAFEDTHRRVMENEVALDGSSDRRGSRARSEEKKQRLQACRSMAE
jgi:hypothetical protein